MKNILFISIRLTIATAFLFGTLYPLFITGISKIVAPNGGKGKEVMVNNQLALSLLVRNLMTQSILTVARLP